jgi:hypothetical protein
MCGTTGSSYSSSVNSDFSELPVQDLLAVAIWVCMSMECSCARAIYNGVFPPINGLVCQYVEVRDTKFLAVAYSCQSVITEQLPAGTLFGFQTQPK